MAYIDDLRKKAVSAETLQNQAIHRFVKKYTEVIKDACEYAAGNGKRSLDGFINTVLNDSEGGIDECSRRDAIISSYGMLFEESDPEEEAQMIQGLRNELKKLGFTNSTIDSYHPGSVVCGSREKNTVRNALFGYFLGRKVELVDEYRETHGFFIEVHIRW